MDLVDEQHVALFEIGEQRGEIAGLRDHGARGGAEADAELARHDLRQRGLAEAGRTDEQHVIERLAALACRLDEDREILARLRLADKLRQELRAQRGIGRILVAALGRRDAGGRGHGIRIARRTCHMIGGRAPLPFAGRGWGWGSTRGPPPWLPPTPTLPRKGGGSAALLD